MIETTSRSTGTLMRIAIRSSMEILIVVLVSTSSVAAQTIRRSAAALPELSAPGLQEKTIAAGSSERWFLVRPPGDKTRPAPIMLILHGGGQSMRLIKPIC
jgi:poly(3-hydroxybutyrate) depolymerase